MVKAELTEEVTSEKSLRDSRSQLYTKSIRGNVTCKGPRLSREEIPVLQQRETAEREKAKKWLELETRAAESV